MLISFHRVQKGESIYILQKRKSYAFTLRQRVNLNHFQKRKFSTMLYHFIEEENFIAFRICQSEMEIFSNIYLQFCFFFCIFQRRKTIFIRTSWGKKINFLFLIREESNLICLYLLECHYMLKDDLMKKCVFFAILYLNNFFIHGTK